MTDAGNISFPTTNIHYGGVMELTHIEGDMIVTTSTFELKYTGLVNMNHGFIKTYHMDVEAAGRQN